MVDFNGNLKKKDRHPLNLLVEKVLMLGLYIKFEPILIVWGMSKWLCRWSGLEARRWYCCRLTGTICPQIPTGSCLVKQKKSPSVKKECTINNVLTQKKSPSVKKNV